MVRLFNVYYPLRTLVLLIGEATVISCSFLLALYIRFGPDSYLALNYEYGLYKILLITGCAVFCSYTFDLYAPQKIGSRNEIYIRVLVVLAIVSFILATLGYLFPRVMFGKGVQVLGLTILIFTLIGWRATYDWLMRHSMRERVYIMGTGQRVAELVTALRSRVDLGLDVIGWSGAECDGPCTRDDFAAAAQKLCRDRRVTQVIVAISDRRGVLPVAELLDLRMCGIKVQDANTLFERASGRIKLDDLNPSALIFAEGFRLERGTQLLRRMVSVLVSFAILLLCLPLIPLIALSIKLSSPGPLLFRQERVGRNGASFTLYKFRTMRQDAEAVTGPTWATDDDPRITTVGRYLRISRLDEIPQLWNVLRGDMGFVGPRPERPEFVQWLRDAIPYYHLRHIVRPGVTGWAQVRYPYGASLEQAKEKLEYDLYYIKHMSVALDLLILIETVKTVLRAGGR